ncbi:MAG: MlaD family protein, partial [Duncaniella sp.]|nr:MlaD family protein [Duncaniella sp.]
MKKREFIIGLSVIIALGILFYGINYLKGINIFKAANYYYVSYTDVAGLAQSAPVSVNGFKVGMVREINYDYDHPGHVKVELSLDRHLRIPEDTKAMLVSDILGTTTVDLRLGTSPKMAEVGSELIPQLSSGMMDKVSNELMPTLISIAPHVDSLVVALTAIATDPALTSSVKRLDIIMANLETSTARLNASMAGVPRLVSTANATLGNVQEITADLKSVSAALASLSEDIKKIPLDSTMQN